MRNKLLTFAGALALLAVFGRFYAQPVLAQVRAALVQSVDEAGRNPYQQSVFFNQTQAVCTPFACTVNFKPVPAGFRLVITHASAAFGIVHGGSDAGASLVSSADSCGQTVACDQLGLPAPVRIFFGNPDLYQVSSPVTFYVGPGQTPQMKFDGQFLVNDGSLTASAAIVGHLVSVP